MRIVPLCLVLLLPVAALAEGHGVTVVNRSSDTIRRIQISPAGAASAGENRLRSQLPPNAEAHIGFSSGCRADVRIGYDGGRTEQFLDQDACGAARVTAGQGAPGPATSGPATPGQSTSSTSTSGQTGSATASAGAAGSRQGHKGRQSAAVKPELVVVPPWTGRSITKRFGGMD